MAKKPKSNRYDFFAFFHRAKAIKRLSVSYIEHVSCTEVRLRNQHWPQQNMTEAFKHHWKPRSNARVKMVMNLILTSWPCWPQKLLMGAREGFARPMKPHGETCQSSESNKDQSKNRIEKYNILTPSQSTHPCLHQLSCSSKSKT